MVQKKAHKSKPKSQKQAHAKPKEFDAQLGALGLRIVHITADGNCLFRAVADQLEGNEEEHTKYRKMVVDYIEGHREEFEPFLEDDVSFDDYCKEMRKTSTWAGHMELQVISLVTHTNICIHRLLSPRWHIQNFGSAKTCCIHLSYHDGLHYNSVRREDDNGEGPAKPILLETPTLEERSEAKGTVARQKNSSNSSSSKKAQPFSAEEQTFEETGWDLQGVDAENVVNESDSRMEPEAVSMLIESKDGEDMRSENGDAATSTKSQHAQRAARNKACPCGSKKKYKACCGAVTRSNGPQEMTQSSSTKVLSNKARKQKLRNEKSIVHARSEVVSIKEPLDMGFLCI